MKRKSKIKNGPVEPDKKSLIATMKEYDDEYDPQDTEGIEKLLPQLQRIVSRINIRKDRIKREFNGIIADYKKLGDKLIAAEKIGKKYKTKAINFMERELDFSTSTAYNCIDVAKYWEEIKQVSQANEIDTVTAALEVVRAARSLKKSPESKKSKKVIEPYEITSKYFFRSSVKMIKQITNKNELEAYVLVLKELETVAQEKLASMQEVSEG